MSSTTELLMTINDDATDSESLSEYLIAYLDSISIFVYLSIIAIILLFCCCVIVCMCIRLQKTEEKLINVEINSKRNELIMQQRLQSSEQSRSTPMNMTETPITSNYHFSMSYPSSIQSMNNEVANTNTNTNTNGNANGNVNNGVSKMDDKNDDKRNSDSHLVILSENKTNLGQSRNSNSKSNSQSGNGNTIMNHNNNYVYSNSHNDIDYSPNSTNNNANLSLNMQNINNNNNNNNNEQNVNVENLNGNGLTNMININNIEQYGHAYGMLPNGTIILLNGINNSLPLVALNALNIGMNNSVAAGSGGSAVSAVSGASVGHGSVAGDGVSGGFVLMHDSRVLPMASVGTRQTSPNVVIPMPINTNNNNNNMVVNGSVADTNYRQNPTVDNNNNNNEKKTNLGMNKSSGSNEYEMNEMNEMSQMTSIVVPNSANGGWYNEDNMADMADVEEMDDIIYDGNVTDDVNNRKQNNNNNNEKKKKNNSKHNKNDDDNGSGINYNYILDTLQLRPQIVDKSTTMTGLSNVTFGNVLHTNKSQNNIIAKMANFSRQSSAGHGYNDNNNNNNNNYKKYNQTRTNTFLGNGIYITDNGYENGYGDTDIDMSAMDTVMEKTNITNDEMVEMTDTRYTNINHDKFDNNNKEESERHKLGQMLQNMKQDYVVQVDLGNGMGQTDLVISPSVSTILNSVVKLTNDQNQQCSNQEQAWSD